jgi:hypothetical protein
VGPVPRAPAKAEPLDPKSAIIQRAADATPAAADFQPDESHRKIAAALLAAGDGDFSSWRELAERADVGRTTLWRASQNPAACLWITEQLAGLARASLGAVYSRLFRLAMTSRSPQAIELFMRRFDPDFKKETGPVDNSINAEFAVVTQMSAQELEKFVELKARKAGIKT